MFQGWFLSVTAWLCLTWLLPCGLDPLPRASEFLRRLFVHCPTTEGCMPNTSFYRWAQITCYRTGSVRWNHPKEWDSLVLGWTGWPKVLGQGVGIIAKQLLATAVVMHHLIVEQELPWAGSLQVSLPRAAPCAPHQHSHSAACPARLAWFTCGLTHCWPLPEGKWVGTHSTCEASLGQQKAALPASARGCQHCPGGWTGLSAELHSHSWYLPLNTGALNAAKTDMHMAVA